MKRICDFISRYMGVIVLLTAVVSLLLPASFVWVDTVYINPLLGLVMFGMGLTLNPNDFKIVFSRPKDVIIGCLAQFIIMPVIIIRKTKCFRPAKRNVQKAKRNVFVLDTLPNHIKK